jgi:hypothetical protein
MAGSLARRRGLRTLPPVGIPMRRRVVYLAAAVAALFVLSALDEWWQLGALGFGLVAIGVSVIVQARRARRRRR